MRTLFLVAALGASSFLAACGEDCNNACEDCRDVVETAEDQCLAACDDADACEEGCKQTACIQDDACDGVASEDDCT